MRIKEARKTVMLQGRQAQHGSECWQINEICWATRCQAAHRRLHIFGVNTEFETSRRQTFLAPSSALSRRKEDHGQLWTIYPYLLIISDFSSAHRVSPLQPFSVATHAPLRRMVEVHTFSAATNLNQPCSEYEWTCCGRLPAN